MSNKKQTFSPELGQRLLIRTLLLVGGILFIHYLGWPLVKLFSPLIVAALVARIFSPLVNRAYRKAKIPQKLVAFLCVIFFLLLIFVPIYIILAEGINQVVKIADSLSSYEAPDLNHEPNEGFSWLSGLLPEELAKEIQLGVNDVFTRLQEGSSKLWKKVIATTGDVVSRVANLSFWLFTFFMSLYFILAEHETICGWFKSVIPMQSRKRISLLESTSFTAFFKYLKGIFHLAIYCFFFMLIAFTVVGHPFTILLAFIFAILDILPIVGALTALVPWCIYELVLGDQVYGLKLLLIVVIYFVSRKILEPRIMGDATGLHPLTTLLAIYVGSRLNGLLGAVVAPILLILFLGLYHAGIFNDWIKDFYELKANLRVFLKRRKSGI